MKKTTKIMTALGLISMISTTALFSQTPTVTVDENGHGFYNGNPLAYVVGPDPSGGVAANVLIYTLPIQVSSGDVALIEPSQPGTAPPTSDLIRFFTPTLGGSSELIFYSDQESSETTLDLADSGIPSSPNAIPINEVGPENNNGAQWAAVNTAPGALPSGGEVIYNIISDVPEPGSMALLLAGLGVLLGINGFCRKNLR